MPCSRASSSSRRSTRSPDRTLAPLNSPNHGYRLPPVLISIPSPLAHETADSQTFRVPVGARADGSTVATAIELVGLLADVTTVAVGTAQLATFADALVSAVRRRAETRQTSLDLLIRQGDREIRLSLTGADDSVVADALARALSEAENSDTPPTP